jgi:hypothetical protein
MPDETPDETPETPETPEVDGLGDAGKRAIQSERRRADSFEKQLKAFRAEAQSKADAELSELERVKKENAELLSNKASADLATIRLQVALEKGLTSKDAARLQGTDYETLSADAEDFVESLAERNSGNKQTSPKPDPSQGAKGSGGAATPARQFADAFDF